MNSMKVNNMNIGIGDSSNDSINSFIEPTHTDVLLGRGVKTNRHIGNTNFRQLVSQHVRQYVTSTKTEKISITRSIVEHVQTQLSPPGRFLEKDQASGYWKEVDTKRAHEKTAQALRDGAALLRKRLSVEITSDPLFLLDDFDKKFDVERPAKKTRKLVSAEDLILPSMGKKKEQVQEKSNTVWPEFDLGLSTREATVISPIPSTAASVNEFDLSLPLVDSRGDEVLPIDDIISNQEIFELWCS